MRSRTATNADRWAQRVREAQGGGAVTNVRPATVSVTRRSKVRLPVCSPSEMREVQGQRPRTRGDCLNGPRPCPWVSCAHHTYLSVSEETGSIKLHYPDLEVWEMVETCVLDVAERGAPGSGKGEGITLDEVSTFFNVTNERVRQIEEEALAKVKKALKSLAGAALATIVEEEGYDRPACKMEATQEDEDEDADDEQ